MKTTVRKIASVTAALAMSLGMLVATAAPASAQARPKIAFDAVTPAIINQPFDVDYSCYKDATNPNEPDTDTGDPWYLNQDMELPPGLTFDTNDNQIIGVGGVMVTSSRSTLTRAARPATCARVMREP